MINELCVKARRSLAHHAPLIADITKVFPLNVTAGTRYPEKQLSGLGI